MIQSIIKYLLGKLAGITSRQWATALFYVVEVAKNKSLTTGSERKTAVTNAIKSLWPEISTMAVNLLIEVAVAFTRKK
jgi:hypothetical protein